MNVQDVMSRDVRCVRTVEHLDAAARILWEGDCGFVPVLDAGDALVGVLTDRDLCMATYTQGRPLGQIPVTQVMSRQLTTCTPGQSLADAMQAMASLRVHRLPVVGDGGKLVGVLAIADLVQVAQQRPAALPAERLLATLAAIKAPRRAAANVTQASADSSATGSGGGAAASGAGVPAKVDTKTTAAVAPAPVATQPAASPSVAPAAAPAATEPTVIVPAAAKTAAKPASVPAANVPAAATPKAKPKKRR